MFKRLKTLWQLSNPDKPSQDNPLDPSLACLSDEDRLKIAQLYVDPKYKCFIKLIEQVKVDFALKALRDCETIEDLRGRQWANRCLQLLQNLVKENYKKNIATQVKVDPDKLQDLPDETPIEF